MDLKTITVADSGPIRTITLNRPARRNAMTPEMQVELTEAFEEAATSSARVVVLTGAGGAFCSGLDLAVLREMQDVSPSDHHAEAERVARLFLALHDLPMPTIAAVQGPAIAGGCGLAIICDFTVAASDATFGFTEVRIGFIPAVVSVFLALHVGEKISRDLLLTGRIINSEEALRLGLITSVVAPQEFAVRVTALAETLTANSPQSLAATKRLVNERRKPHLDSAILGAIDAYTEARSNSDLREGLAAFLEKRKPNW
ncbi:MAG TPA: enoyl-CoA hydratase-related protein [Terracidiphilus sp.]|nr:enoyl-CoA hydratase-related protein [Terracidiphilus sp.]